VRYTALAELRGFPLSSLRVLLSACSPQLSDHDKDFELAGQCEVTWVKECWHTTSDDQLPTAPESKRSEAGLTTTCWRSFYALFSAEPLPSRSMRATCVHPQLERAYAHASLTPRRLPVLAAPRVHLGVPTSHTEPPNATRYSRTFEAWPEFVLDAHETNCSEFGRYRHLPKGCQSTDASLTPSGKFRTGESYPCWRAARAGIDRRYQCQNAGTCYKINNPHAIVQRHIDSATRPLVFGGTLGVGGILLACLSLVICSPLMRFPGGKAHQKVPTVPVRPPPEMIISGTRRKFNSDEKPPPEVDGLPSADGGDGVPQAHAPSERV
jgi:hypothetical protein